MGDVAVEKPNRELLASRAMRMFSSEKPVSDEVMGELAVLIAEGGPLRPDAEARSLPVPALVSPDFLVAVGAVPNFGISFTIGEY